MKIRTLLICMVSLAAAGCATMSEDECRVADWRTLGYEDGAAGRSAAVLGTRREACAEHGVVPDLDAYRDGRALGLREFCQPHNGYNLGARGSAYDGVCPADMEAAFVAAYQKGQELYSYTSRVSRADAQIAAKQQELYRLEDNLRESEALLVSSDATNEERAEALLEIKDYAHRKGELEAELRQLEQDRARYAAQLEAYREQAEYGP